MVGKIGFRSLEYESCSRVAFLDPNRPDPAKRWPDPTRNCDKTPDRTPPPLLYYVSGVQHSSCRQGTMYNCCLIFSGLVMFLTVKKSISIGLISRSWSRGNKKTAHIRCYSEVHSRFNLSSSKLWSLNKVYPARFQQTNQSARLDPCIQVQYCFDCLYQPAIVILIRDNLIYIGSNKRKVFIGESFWVKIGMDILFNWIINSQLFNYYFMI